MSFISKHKISISVLAIVIVSVLVRTVVFATPPGSPYNPGETLDPTCTTTDVNCEVLPPLTSLAGAVLTDQTTPQTIGTTGNRLAKLWATDITTTDLTVANTITGSVSGSAATATTATNIAGGVGGSIPYQSAAGTTAMLANGTAGQVLQSNGTTLAPSWTTASSGDMVLASIQTVTGAKTFNDAKLLLRNVANTFNGSFTNTNTADRVYTLKDASGTLAFTSDITGTNSGTNTGDQTITLTGGVTGSGTGSFAATVITNANLTGPITSVGNATSVASQSGTGSTFVMDSSPVINGSVGINTPSPSGALSVKGTLDIWDVNTEFKAIFDTNSLAADRTFTFPDNSGTFALTGIGLTSFTNDAGFLTSASGVTSVSGTASRITSTGGTTPVIDISASYIGQTSITTLGTISTGTWSGTAIAVNKGGTNCTSATITCFNNITGFSAAGTTGTTSTNLVFSGAPAFTTSISTPSIITASGALGITPSAGSNLNVTLSTTGDFAVNTDQLYVDTSATNVGIGDTSPSAKFVVGNGDLFQVNSSGNITFNQSSPILSIGNTGTLTFRDSAGPNNLCSVADSNDLGNLACTGAFRISSTNVARADIARSNFFFGAGGNLSGSGSNGDNLVMGGGMASLTTGSKNIGIGFSALNAVNTGSDNIGIGAFAMWFNNTGSGNIGIGSGALGANTDGNYNTAIGREALGVNVHASKNVAVGYQALRSTTVGTLTDTFNTGVGLTAGYSITTGGTKNTIIGASDPGITTTSGNTVIGNGVTGMSGLTNTIIIAASSSGTKRIIVDDTGEVNIGGDTTPNALLSVGSTSQFQVNSSGAIAAATGITSSGTITFSGLVSCAGLQTNGSGVVSCTPSDRNLKTNFNDFTDGLDFVRNVQPQTYTFKEGTTYFDNDRERLGLIAQDVERAGLRDAVIPMGNGYLQVDYNAVTVATLQAVKEMDLKITDIDDMDEDNDWRDSLVAWTSNAVNHITRVFTGEICLTDPGEEAVCLSRSELAALNAKALAKAQNHHYSPPNPAPDPEITPDSEPTPEPEVDTPPEPEPTPEETPAPDPAPNEAPQQSPEPTV